MLLRWVSDPVLAAIRSVAVFLAPNISFSLLPLDVKICMFCYHHIKNNLNGRCPACRREYLEENVEFTAVAKEE